MGVDSPGSLFAFDPGTHLGPYSYNVVDISTDGRPLLNRFSGYVLVDTSGVPVWAFDPDGVRPSFDAVRLAADGRSYLAWDSFRESGPNIVQWRIGDRLVRKELPPYTPNGGR